MEITAENLKAARNYAARLVKNQGPQYMPLYTRLKAELDALAEQETELEEAQRLAEELLEAV